MTAEAPPTTIVWLRRDLRLEDNAALAAAAATGPVVPVFVLDEAADDRAIGGAGRWWLGRSLSALGVALARCGSPLVLRRGASVETLMALARESGARAIFASRSYEPAAIELERTLDAAAAGGGIRFERFAGGLIHDPSALRTGAGAGFKVFAAFWRALRARVNDADLALAPATRVLVPPAQALHSEALADWSLEPRAPDWAAEFDGDPGEDNAKIALERFVAERLSNYAQARDRPDIEGSSRLSAHLHWGELSPRQVWRAVALAAQARGEEAAVDKYLSEIAWREFAHHLLWNDPTLGSASCSPRMRQVAWRKAPAELDAWRQGRTGYPIVDAGMRQLWRTGFMPNRVRMITASFLVKDLLIDWREGERWFWDTLGDADAANNAMNWQWIAGSGPDASPFFRVFNPITQGAKFDPLGTFVRRWIPELARMPARWLHAPWTAPPEVFAAAGLVLGADYPAPIVDHAQARLRALAAYARTGD